MRPRLSTSRRVTPMVVSGALVVACAQGESLSERPELGGGAAGTGAIGGGGFGTAGTMAGMGGMTPTAGTGGSVSTAGTGFTGGAAGLGGTSAGTAGGGTGGSAGTAGAGGSAGSGGSSGSGGKAGSGGTGGMPPVGCAEDLPNKTSWSADASDYSDMCANADDPLCNPPDNAIDDDTDTRFSTGDANGVGMAPDGQQPGMWLQIDFGVQASVNEVTLSITAGDTGDQPAGYEVYVSNTNANTDDTPGTPVETGSATAAATHTISFTAATGRYLLIRLTTAKTTNWWTVYELDADCN